MIHFQRPPAAFSSTATLTLALSSEARLRPVRPPSPCLRPGVLGQSGLNQQATVNILLLVASFSLFVATTVADTASITNFSAALTTNGVTVQFSLANASNAVPYNLYGANSLTQKFWTYLGPIFASNTYTFSNQMFSSSWYRLSGPPVTMVVAWGDDYYNEADVPPGLTNVIAVASGYEHNLALQSEGTLVSWGYTNATANWVPTNLPRVKAIAAGWYYNVALLQDGAGRRQPLDPAQARDIEVL